MEKILVSRVKELRERRKMTQRQLATIIGKTETTVRNWEHGRSGLEWFEAVAQLCNALDCTPNELFDYEKQLGSEQEETARAS